MLQMILKNFPSVFFLFFAYVSISRSSRKTKEFTVNPPAYDLHKGNKLPSDLQVTTFLTKGEKKE